MENYHIERRLAQGSTSSVFRVIRVNDRTSFVMKRIPLETANEQEILAADREVELYKKINHPCIVGLVDHFEAFLNSTPFSLPKNNSPKTTAKAVIAIAEKKQRRGDLCLILEPMFHGDISSVLAQLRVTSPHQPIAESIVMGWFVQIALALQYLHSRSIVHGDVKSSNIFINDNTQFVAVGDLGSAFVTNIPFYVSSSSSSVVGNNNNNGNKMTNPQLQFQMLLAQHNNNNSGTDHSSSLLKSWEQTACGGTMNYFSPERMLNGVGASYQGDVWALGILLAETAAMVHPFSDCRDINQLVVRISRGDVPQLPSTVLAAAGNRDMQNLLNFILQADPVRRPTIDDILAHPYVKRHMERFFSMLMSPPPEVYSDFSDQGGSKRDDGRWNRFVVGTDKLNPHRVILHKQLELQMSQFSPAFSNSYFGSGARSYSSPQSNNNNNNNNNNSGINIDTSNSRISIPRTNLRMQHHPPVLTTLEDQAEVKSFLHATNASLSPSRHYVNTTPIGGHHQNNNNNSNSKKGNNNNNNNNNDSIANNNHAKQRMHVGGVSSLNSLDPLNHNFSTTGVVSPEHISPNALKPFLHQQIPLSQIRGQQTSAPFWTDDQVSPFKKNQQQRNSDNNNNNNSYYSNTGGEYTLESMRFNSDPFAGGANTHNTSKNSGVDGSSSKKMAEIIAPFLQRDQPKPQPNQSNKNNNNNNNNNTSLLSSVSPQREKQRGAGDSSFAPAPYSSVQRTIAKVLGM